MNLVVPGVLVALALLSEKKAAAATVTAQQPTSGSAVPLTATPQVVYLQPQVNNAVSGAQTAPTQTAQPVSNLQNVTNNPTPAPAPTVSSGPTPVTQPTSGGMTTTETNTSAPLQTVHYSYSPGGNPRGTSFK